MSFLCSVAMPAVNNEVNATVLEFSRPRYIVLQGLPGSFDSFSGSS